MKREYAAIFFIVLMIISISFNAYEVNKSSTVILEKIYTLPTDTEVFSKLSEEEFERYRVKINEITVEWEKFSKHLVYILRYTDFEKIHHMIYNMSDSFATKRTYEYLTMRKQLLTAMERQKKNELPSIENIF